MALIKKIQEISKSDVSIAGGKGASLGEMARAGISVPDGFVVLSESFEIFLENGGLNSKVGKILDSIDHDNESTTNKASEKIQDLILGAGVPLAIEEEIKKYYQEFNFESVAVRSSATAEDGASAAWAGQLESYLNTSRETLLENVKKCWASLFTPRAIFYRFENGFHNKNIAVAVVVQKMIDSKIAGVMFSANPVTLDRNQIVLEACFGLGEALVQGLDTPDSFLINKKNFKVIGKNIILDTLSDEQATELAKLAVKIEKHYGFPVDIEWAIGQNNEISILQCRPITTLNF